MCNFGKCYSVLGTVLTVLQKVTSVEINICLSDSITYCVTDEIVFFSDRIPLMGQNHTVLTVRTKTFICTKLPGQMCRCVTQADICISSHTHTYTTLQLSPRWRRVEEIKERPTVHFKFCFL